MLRIVFSEVRRQFVFENSNDDDDDYDDNDDDDNDNNNNNNNNNNKQPVDYYRYMGHKACRVVMVEIQ